MVTKEEEAVVETIKRDPTPPPPPRVLKSVLKRQHEPDQEEVYSEVHETQGAYRGTRSRSRSVAPPRKKVRFSKVLER